MLRSSGGKEKFASSCCEIGDAVVAFVKRMLWSIGCKRVEISLFFFSLARGFLFLFPFTHRANQARERARNTREAKRRRRGKISVELLRKKKDNKRDLFGAPLLFVFDVGNVLDESWSLFYFCFGFPFLLLSSH